jgi:DNA-binding transcriptional LysR family regulator
MDRLRALEIFIKVAETGGFAAAARMLSMSPPSVTRVVSGLEQHLGTALFVRTTRSVGLTEAGTRFLQDATRILSDLAEAEDAAVGAHIVPRGELRITAPVLFGGIFVTPLLGEFLERHQHVTAEAVFVDRIVNMIDEGHDVAIRIGELADSSLTAIRVGTIRLMVFAAPEYLVRAGTPSHPDELAGHRLILPIPLGGTHSWHFQRGGKQITVRPTARLKINANDAIRDQVARGWGISRLRSYQIAPLLADGRVVPILEEFEPPPQPIHIIHQEGRLASAKVRSFVDFVVERLRADASINA